MIDDLMDIKMTEITKYANYVLSGISLVSGISVVSLYFFFKEIRLFLYEIIMLLCLGRIILDIASFFPITDDDKSSPSFICKLQGGILYSFQKYTWIMCTYLLYFTYIYGLQRDYLWKNAKIIRPIFVIFALILSFSFGVSAYVLNVISFNGVVCVLTNKVSEDKNSNLTMILISLLFDTFFICLNIYLLIKIFLAKKLLSKKTPEFTKIFSIIIMFPILKFVCWLPSFSMLIYITPGNNENDTVVSILSFLITFCSSIFTFICGIIYLRLPHVRISVKAFLKRLFGGKDELDLLEESDFLNIAKEANPIK